MKYYECDMCGEICRATTTFNPLKDGDWACVQFNIDGKEIDWDYDKKTNTFITHDIIAITHHYCPQCYQRYYDFYRPFIPKMME